MTTTELALVSTPEAPETQELSAKDARALDKKIRAKGDSATKGLANVDKTLTELGDLIQQAVDGEIHKGLGLKSWTVWAKDAIRIDIPDRFQRGDAVRALSKDSGMSQRALAVVFNVSQKTIDRDLDGADVDEGATVTSLDGAQRPKNKPAKDVEPEQDYIEGEVVSTDDAPMTAAEIVTAFDDEMANLYAAQNELYMLYEEDKWDAARNRVVKANLDDLNNVIDNLIVIRDDLTGKGE